jgi:hypothetical protein
MKQGHNDYRLRTRLQRLLYAAPFALALGGWFGWDHVPFVLNSGDPAEAVTVQHNQPECQTPIIMQPVSGAQIMIDRCLSADDFWRR